MASIEEETGEEIFRQYIQKSGKAINNIEIISPRLLGQITTFINPESSRDRLAKFKVAQGGRQFAFGIFDKDFRDKDPLFQANGDPGQTKVNLKYPMMRLLPNNITDDQIYDFYFPFMPQEIQYSNLSDEVAEIPRAGTTPIVTFKSQRLMKISFEFLVAFPNDGLIRDIEDSISILRFMAMNSQRSIVFFNMDTLFQIAQKYRTMYNQGSDIRWNIVELEMTSRRRNEAGLITQASFNITLQENRNPSVTIVKVPTPQTTVKKCVDKKTGKKVKCRPEKQKQETVDLISSGMDAIFAEGGLMGANQAFTNQLKGG